MRTWAKVGLVFIAVVIGASAMQAARSKPQISWKCNASKASGDCVIENKGDAPGMVEFDAVLVCHDGEHRAHVSANVDPHSHITKIIGGFTPGVGLLTSCVNIDYRNTSVR